jgi:hypothetical protein
MFSLLLLLIVPALSYPHLRHNHSRHNSIQNFSKELVVYNNTVSSFTYKSCGTSSDIAQNLKLDVSPVLPQTDYTLFLNTDLSKEVTGGTSKYSISFNGIPFSPTTNDLCEEIANSNTTCPLYVGNYASQSKGTIPSGVSGKVIIKNEWFNTKSERILCMEYTIKV